MKSKLKYLNILFLIIGIAVFVIIIRKAGTARLWEEVRAVGTGIVFIVLFPVTWTLLNTIGWYTALGSSRKKVRFSKLLIVRQAGEALNYIIPSGYMGGEPIKAHLIRDELSMSQSLASVIIAKTTQTIAQLMYFLIGIVFALFMIDISFSMKVSFVSAMLLLGGGLFIFSVLQQNGIFSIFLSLTRKIGIGKTLFQNMDDKARRVDDHIKRLYREDRTYFLLSILVHFAGWLFGIMEIRLIMFLLGEQITWGQSFFAATLTSLASASGFFIPGSLGAFELGHFYVFKLVGLDPSVGLALGILRRVRELAWVGIGLAFFFILGGTAFIRKKTKPESGESSPLMQPTETP